MSSKKVLAGSMLLCLISGNIFCCSGIAEAMYPSEKLKQSKSIATTFLGRKLDSDEAYQDAIDEEAVSLSEEDKIKFYKVCDSLNSEGKNSIKKLLGGHYGFFKGTEKLDDHGIENFANMLNNSGSAVDSFFKNFSSVRDFLGDDGSINNFWKLFNGLNESGQKFFVRLLECINTFFTYQNTSNEYKQYGCKCFAELGKCGPEFMNNFAILLNHLGNEEKFLDLELAAMICSPHWNDERDEEVNVVNNLEIFVKTFPVLLQEMCAGENKEVNKKMRVFADLLKVINSGDSENNVSAITDNDFDDPGSAESGSAESGSAESERRHLFILDRFDCRFSALLEAFVKEDDMSSIGKFVGSWVNLDGTESEKKDGSVTYKENFDFLHDVEDVNKDCQAFAKIVKELNSEKLAVVLDFFAGESFGELINSIGQADADTECRGGLVKMLKFAVNKSRDSLDFFANLNDPRFNKYIEFDNKFLSHLEESKFDKLASVFEKLKRFDDGERGIEPGNFFGKIDSDGAFAKKLLQLLNKSNVGAEDIVEYIAGRPNAAVNRYFTNNRILGSQFHILSGNSGN